MFGDTGDPGFAAALACPSPVARSSGVARDDPGDTDAAQQLTTVHVLDFGTTELSLGVRGRPTAPPVSVGVVPVF
ncbi:MAG: hypothetical protein JO100_03935 [Pseudonocardia sp.]|nr:hypothetical protein [Pseudonocardia sp.]